MRENANPLGCSLTEGVLGCMTLRSSRHAVGCRVHDRCQPLDLNVRAFALG
jgi:hypothetical protein